MVYSVLDLFAGIGGFSLGLERTGGFDTVAFCEICPKARKVLSKHWPNVKQYTDIRELTGDQLKKDGIEIDVITGGFPCQDISCAGKAKGILAERSGLWAEMFRLIRDVRPTWAIIENVSALRSKGLTLVLQNLCEIGYCAEWHCIPASAVGAPHQRDRIWIIANPNNSRDRTSQRRDMPKIRKAILQGWQEHTLSEPSGYCEDVANSMQQHKTQRGEREITESKGDGGGTEQGRSEGDAERQRSIRCSGSSTCDEVANSNSQQRQDPTTRQSGEGQERKLHTQEESKAPHDLRREVTGCGCLRGEPTQADFWAVEPNVGRVAHGIPNRVDRLKQLGNSVVPQIPELLGYAILECDRANGKQ